MERKRSFNSFVRLSVMVFIVWINGRIYRSSIQQFSHFVFINAADGQFLFANFNCVSME